MKRLATAFTLAFAFIISSVIMTTGIAHADSNYPTLAYCTGNNVNLRDRPNTSNSRVLDQANEFQLLVVLGETRAGKDIWYEIQHPNGGKNDTVWIIGRYVEVSFTDIDSQPGGTKLLISINKNFSTSPARAQKVFGKPTKRNVEHLTKSASLEKLSWPGLELEYLNNRLTSVSVTERNLPNGELASFYSVWIGDPVKEIEAALGEPDGRYDNQIIYRSGDQNVFSFILSDDGSTVESMNYQFYYDIAEED